MPAELCNKKSYLKRGSFLCNGNYKQNNEANHLTNIVKQTNKGMLKGTKHCQSL